MTKEAALYNFWASFGIPAYEESSVPTGDNAPNFPYITYQVVTDSIGYDTVMTASVWYRSSSWLEPNAKAREIDKRISRSGILLPYDGGALWLKRGTPFAQNMGDDSDDLIRRKILNISAEYISAD